MSDKLTSVVRRGAIKANPHVLTKRLGEQMVLFNLDSDRVYELSATAARFWELLTSGHDTGHAREQILEEFVADPDDLVGEADDLLESLRREGLISVD